MRGPIEFMSIEERYWLKVDVRGADECWPWTAAVNKVTGYGVFHPARTQTTTAHRFGAVLAGLIDPRDPRHVDHACHNDAGCPPGPCPHRLCQNPRHFEAVTSAVNVNRSHNSNARKSHCQREHEYTPENTRIHANGARSCLECARLADQKRKRVRHV